jgi:hypothetical protein
MIREPALVPAPGRASAFAVGHVASSRGLLRMRADQQCQRSQGRRKGRGTPGTIQDWARAGTR